MNVKKGNRNEHFLISSFSFVNFLIIKIVFESTVMDFRDAFNYTGYRYPFTRASIAKREPINTGKWKKGCNEGFRNYQNSF